MENHLHLVLKADGLSGKIQRFKSFTALEIIKEMRINGKNRWLRRLKSVKSIHHEGIHQFWREGFYPKQVVGDDMMLQKVEYIHQNPVKRGFVRKPEHWRYSSAANYLGEEGLIAVTVNWYG